jgi:hypothetical protein
VGSFRRSSGAPAGAIGFPFPFRPGGYAPLHHRLISGLPSGDSHHSLWGLSSLSLGTLITRSGDSHHPSGDSHPSLWGLSSPPPGTLITPSGDSHHPLRGLSSLPPRTLITRSGDSHHPRPEGEEKLAGGVSHRFPTKTTMRPGRAAGLKNPAVGGRMSRSQ